MWNKEAALGASYVFEVGNEQLQGGNYVGN